VPLRHRETVRGLAREIDTAMAGFLRDIDWPIDHSAKRRVIIKRVASR
jgi:hypothetical protein